MMNGWFGSSQLSSAQLSSAQLSWVHFGVAEFCFAQFGFSAVRRRREQWNTTAFGTEGGSRGFESQRLPTGTHCRSHTIEFHSFLFSNPASEG